MFGFKFLGSTKVPHRKNTAGAAPVRMPAPKEILLPMAQHIGAPAVPVVKVGDEVKVGQLVAEASGAVSSPIHSSVSGKVTKIDTYLTPSGKTVDAIRIESDGLMTPFEGITPPTVTDLESLIEAVRASGLVGLGGAGFPTAVKLSAAKAGGIHTVVFNGAECEPYLTCDDRTMQDRSSDLFEGVALLEKHVPTIEKFIFAVESNKPNAIAELARIFQDNPKVSVKPLPPLYPQGAERVTVYNSTGIIVPEGKFPADLGVLIMNVTSLATMASYVRTGMPLVEKCITVDGSAIANPMNVIAPIGTTIGDIIEFTGGEKETIGKLIYGGPMMGSCACSLDEPVFKTTNGILAFKRKHSAEPEASACIHCGKCVEVCPMGLSPVSINKALTIDNIDDRMKELEYLCLTLCMDCGCCSFVCPAKRPLVQSNRIAKTAYRAYKAHKATLK